MKKDIMLSYSAPMLDVYEVAAECGYSVSTIDPGFEVPGFGSEDGGDLTWN